MFLFSQNHLTQTLKLSVGTWGTGRGPGRKGAPGSPGPAADDRRAQAQGLPGEPWLAAGQGRAAAEPRAPASADLHPGRGAGDS